MLLAAFARAIAFCCASLSQLLQQVFFFLAGLRYRVALREGPGLFLLWRVLFILLSLAAKMRVVSMHALITAALVGYFVSFWRLFLNQQ